MLERLYIKNIAVIDETEISFGEHFCVMTGETGAGKSIIIDAINMAVGERTSRDVIRTGEQKAVVTAQFSVDEGVIAALSELGVESDGELIIHREIDDRGKSVTRINGVLSTTAAAKEIGRLVINIHGQHDNQALLNPSKHIVFLDKFADIEDEKQGYFELHRRIGQVSAEIDELVRDEGEKARRLDILSYEINEIEDANLVPDEEEEVLARVKLLSGAEEILEAVGGAYNLLCGSDEAISARDALAQAAGEVGSVSSSGDSIKELADRLDSVIIELDDILECIKEMEDEIEFSGAELDDLQGRLELITKLKRKYGESIGEILDACEARREELSRLEYSDETIKAKKDELERLLTERERKAAKLTAARKNAAKTLCDKIDGEFRDLDMPNVKFAVSITPCEYNPRGADEVEFLVSANVGEDVRPLAKIASGGELSRTMLAIKSILADTDEVKTLIFDEIDAGVSGRAAQKIAEKIDKIAEKKQIICITHLAQIAAMASSHYLIEKDVCDGRTKTRAVLLSSERRAEEIARIIGGAKITQTTLASAREMIKQFDF